MTPRLSARKKEKRQFDFVGPTSPPTTIVPAKKKLKRVRRRSSVRFPTWSQAGVTLVVIFFGLIRIRLLNLPLERDEGEYAYAGQLIQHAIAPYRYCYSMKLPGTAAAYALFTSIFGQTAIGVHLGLLLVNSATTVGVYLLAKRLLDGLAGVVACAAFALLSLQPSVLGFAGHATQFVILPAITGILLLLRAIENPRWKLYFWSGLLVGVSFLMKQPGLVFILFSIAYLSYAEWTQGWNTRIALSRMAVLLFGASLPFALTCLILLRASVFSRFWFWSFTYAAEYGKTVPLSLGLETFWEATSRVVASSPLIWILSAVGAVMLVLGFQKMQTTAVFVSGLFAFSFGGVCVGFHFRPHYFVLLLPAVAILCGVAVSRATAMINESSKSSLLLVIPFLAFAIALGISISHDADFFFQMNPIEASHSVYGENPFPEAETIADFIRSRANADDRIAVIGSEPEIYFNSRLRSATGYVYTYPLMESQPYAATMRREMEQEIQSAMPRFVVFADVPTSWFQGPQSDLSILTWAEQFVGRYYQIVGVADLLESGTRFRWDADARNYKTISPFRMLVFEKTKAAR
jgi:hypothetical protein